MAKPLTTSTSKPKPQPILPGVSSQRAGIVNSGTIDSPLPAYTAPAVLPTLVVPEIRNYKGDKGDPGIATITDYHPTAWDQPTWRIDPINGSDSNTGDDAHPLATFAEQHRRVGLVHEVRRGITLTITSSLPSSDPLNLSGVRSIGWNGFSVSAWFYDVIGLPTVVATGTATAVRQLAQMTNVPHGLTCTGQGISLGSHVRMGRMVRKRSGSNSTDDATHLATGAWLAKDEDGTIARMSHPAELDDGWSPVQCNQGIFNANDSFDIIDLCVVPVVEFPVYDPGFIRFKRLYFSGGVETAVEPSGSTFIQCAMSVPIFVSGYSKMCDCQFGYMLMAEPGVQPYITQGLFLGTQMGMNGRLAIQNYSLLQGCTTWQNAFSDEGLSSGISCHTRGFGVYDSPVSGLKIPMGQVWQLAGTIYGSGNAGYGVEVMRGGRLLLQAASIPPAIIRCTGVLGDISVGGRTSGPAVNITNPYGYTADRAYSFANLEAGVDAGGFNYNIIDPLNPSTAIVRGPF